MNILIIDNGTIRLKELKTLLKNNNVEVVHFTQINISDFMKYDLIILSGSSQYPIIGNEDLYKNELQLIKDSTVPIIGICLGFQLICFAFGAKLHQLEEKKVGSVRLRVSGPNDIFDKLPSLEVHSAHRWVVREVPKELVSLAESEYGIEIIKHSGKDIYGLQFHPEMYLNRHCGDEIFFNIMKSIRA